MEVILLDKIRNLGSLGEKVKVKAGYARNFLIPQSKAVYATKDNIAKFEQRRAELEKLVAEKVKTAAARKEKLSALPVLTINAKASDEGKLFGSIGTRDIADLITAAGVEVEKREVRLPEGVLRRTGEYDVELDLEGDIVAIVKVSVVQDTH